MLAVVGAPTIAGQLVAAGVPPDSILDRVPERDDDADSSDEPSVLRAAGPATVVDLSRGAQEATLALVNGAHGDYRTPGENAAYFFTTFTAEGGSCPTATPIKKAARLHHYSIVEFDGAASKVSAFVASSGQGWDPLRLHARWQRDRVLHDPGGSGRLRATPTGHGVST